MAHSKGLACLRGSTPFGLGGHGRRSLGPRFAGTAENLRMHTKVLSIQVFYKNMKPILLDRAFQTKNLQI